MDAIKAVVYARYSSHNQREESIEGQIRECQAYASRNNFVIIEEYIDRGISGKTDNREAFQRMIKDSEKGHFQAVLMYTLDRFARNRYDSAMYKAKLKKNGVKVYYAKQYIPDEPEGIILESVLEGYAEYYSENLSRNVKRGMTENALSGRANGGLTPLGYRITADKRYEIDPVSAKVVQEIYQMYADGRSAKQIIDHCNKQGYRTARHAVFNKNSLRRILTNERYIGIYRYGEVVHEDCIPPIISKELFDRVQATYKRNYKSRARSKAHVEYLLSTKLFCGHCGSPMVGESGTGKNGIVYHYYKCAEHKRDHSCCKKSEKKEIIEEIVARYAIQTVLTDENIERIATKAMEIIDREAVENQVLSQLQESLKEVTKRTNNILAAIEQGVSIDSMKERLFDLESQKKDLMIQIAHEQNTAKPRLTKERIMFWLESFRQGDIESEEYRRHIIDTLVNSVFVYDTDDGKGRRLVFTFNLSGENTAALKISDLGDNGSPLCANPNTFFVREHTFGFVVEIEDVG